MIFAISTKYTPQQQQAIGTVNLGRLRPDAANEVLRAWFTEETYCNGCGHRWQAVFTDSTEFPLQCPECRGHKGYPVKHIIYTGEHWHCVYCQGILFSIVNVPKQGPCSCCANCGNVSALIDCFPEET